MKLRNAQNYNIGLDMGTNSVGWAATDEEGNPLYFKGKPTWGSRLFPKAETAAAARIPRGQRRRYERRRWRLDLLQELFQEEMAKTDSDFFIRLRQSRLLPEDRSGEHAAYHWPLFNESDFTEVAYYEQFRTIYHLRSWLMSTDERADIRLIYLAFHNIVKHRGNFLHEGNPELSAKQANMRDSIERFDRALTEWCVSNDIQVQCDKEALIKLLEDSGITRRDKQAQAIALFGLDKGYENTMGKAIAQAMVGFVAEFAHVFFLEANDSKFKLSDDEKIDTFLPLCPDEGAELFEAIRAVHSSFVLMGILRNARGGTLSECKVAEYECYKADLKTLKQLVKKYVPNQYDAFFRGETYEGTHLYDPAKAEGYTKYDLGTSKLSYDDFFKAVEKLFKDTAAESDERYAAMKQGFEEGTSLRRLKTSDNGSIPFQLHLEELDAIIINQGKHYPFLLECKDKLDSLVTFRIPYYVGPLTKLNAPSDGKGGYRFAWSERKPGKEFASVKPWNWEEVIDRHKSAEAFMTRMTGTCSYLQGEDVLPKCSLLYEEFCVLNELNGAKWSQDGDDFRRFDHADRIAIMRDIFQKKKTVSYQLVADWMCQQGHCNVHVSSGQGETGFESKLSSYYFFCKDVFGVEVLPESDIPMVEEIILWNTLFEDRNILKEKIEDKYGNRLTPDQIKTICRKRFTGWGKLSKKLLTGVKIETDSGSKCIMDVLREGHPGNGKSSKAMVLMEILHDDVLGFEKTIDECNKQHLEAQGGLCIEDLPGSPALRRSINQALRIVDEIVSIAGNPPANIFIEVTRDEDARKKGQRTKRRYDDLKEALAAFKREDPQVWEELCSRSPKDLDERLTLYFMQRGRCLYSEEVIDISYLSSGMYEVDHIIPRTYVKDDSFENKALVLRGENQRKTDTLLLDSNIRRKRGAFWEGLHEAGLMGDKKYNNLKRSTINDKAMKGFIARQLVETGQIVKMIQMFLSERYEDTNIVPVKAGLSSELRKARGLVKCREVNDYHHAHDAYLACEMGRFIQKRHPKVYENPIAMTHMMRDYIKTQGKEFQTTRRMPGSSIFIVESFLHSGFDKETGEIFKDDWNAEAEVDRIRACLNYKDCFITRMPEETSGAFWDATIYSPRGGKKAPGIEIKNGLSTNKYGGYAGKDYAYFFIYSGTNPKGKVRFFIEGVPLYLQKKLGKSDQALVDYAEKIASQKGIVNICIHKKRVLKYQKFYQDGNAFYLTGESEVRNARQIALSQAEVKLVQEALDGLVVDGDALDRLFLRVLDKAYQIAPRIASILKLKDRAEEFCSVSQEKKVESLVKVLQVLNGAKTQVDLSDIGGSINGGVIRYSLQDLDGIEFADVSVTGMFERRYKLEL